MISFLLFLVHSKKIKCVQQFDNMNHSFLLLLLLLLLLFVTVIIVFLFFYHQDMMSLAGMNKQQQLQGLNQSMYKRCKATDFFVLFLSFYTQRINEICQYLDLFPNSNSLGHSNMTLVVICIVAAVIFLLIMINALIWFIFSLR
jgi:hypothetical protein